MVSDFGIALALGVAGGTRLTETGLSVGTPYYMSPEQATGDQAVGASTDTYALGSVLYEMLVGDPPFAGSTAQAVLGKIIAGKPVSATEQRPSIPANVDAAVRKALEKLPADRFSSAQDFARALGDEHFRYGELATVGADVGVGPWKRLTMGFAAAFLVSVVWNLASSEPRSEPTRRFVIPLPADGRLRGGTSQRLAISRDGRAVIMNMLSGQSGQFPSQLFVRPLENLEAVPIRGTENAGSFFVSPDGEWLAFITAGSGLQKVRLAGGPPETIAETRLAGGQFGASWGDGGTIVFATTVSSGLWQVSDGGGTPEPLTTLDEGSQELHLEPHFLPGSETVLFVVRQPDEPDQIAALSLASGRYEILTPGNWPHYVAGGRLIFLQGDALWAVAFDPTQLAVTGEPVPVLEGVRSPQRFFAVSEDGTLVFAPIGEAAGSPRELVWVGRDGQEESLLFEPQPYVYPRISPQGDRLALVISEDVDNLASEADLWVFDLDRRSRSRITFGGNNRFFPVWTPAGDSLTFSGGIANPNTLFLAPSDGSGGRVPLLELAGLQYPTSWSPDGQTLAYYEFHPETARDLWTRTAEGDPQLFLNTPAQDRAPAFSPDGRWLAFVSDKSGVDEIYVRPFPGPGREFTISTGGGKEPVWSRDGSELFYRSADDLMVVTVDLGATFGRGTPRALFADTYARDNSAAGIAGVPNYDVTPNGQRFVMVRGASAGQDSVIVVTNWFEELRQRMGN